jgi:hypothetical protein
LGIFELYDDFKKWHVFSLEENSPIIQNRLNIQQQTNKFFLVLISSWQV